MHIRINKYGIYILKIDKNIIVTYDLNQTIFLC